MAGIYIHIPFCKKACHYCNFHFSTQLQYIDELTDAILQEIVLQKNYITETIATVYFGGGTPSIIGPTRLAKILTAIKVQFTVAADAEITLEANPDDINPAEIRAWKNMGINRLSIGIQSFAEADLKWMNRAHDAAQAKQCIMDATQNGITNLSIDLIYGTPGLSDEQWLHNINTAVGLGIQHLSCYALTVEPNTALEKMILQKKKEPVDANKAATQMELLMLTTASLGLEHYEISNLALPGYRSKHNSAYWQGKHYLGIGPSAHSYNGVSRQWNVANNALYIKSIQHNTLPFELETLSKKDQYNEYLMTSLRTIEGVDLQKLFAIYNNELDLLAKTNQYITQGLAVLQQHQFILTNKGRLQADGIAADLFI